MRMWGQSRWLFALLVLMPCFAVSARADATLLLEEPYGHFGAFTATGHAAVYLSRVCAETPTRLRRCEPGEKGVVISRYNKVAGYDWMAIPLIPYLYAVEEPDQIPLFANPKLVAFLRNQYRRRYLEDYVPDDPSGEPPQGNWTQLVGSAYDRTLYGYTIETTPDQDENFIAAYNDRSNRPRFNLLAHNCADFATGVINFYYPKTLHRNYIADAGITTPKQIAKMLVKFSAKHPELQSSSFVVPQVPGTMPRSTPVHGVVESLLKSKKYVVPMAVLSPITAGLLTVAYVSEGRFDPSRHAMVLEPENDLQPPLLPTERRGYRNELNLLLAQTGTRWNTWRNQRSWNHWEAKAEPDLDELGRPVLQMRDGESSVTIGLSRDNILTTTAPPALTQELLENRLRTELHRGDPRASESDISSDWKLLQQVLPSTTASLD